jgi:AcrR family transcriptional regulator
MEGQDRRVRRTQHLLAQALIVLTLEKGYDDVTIREITARADVGYATFFRHYPDKDALLLDVLDVVLDELIGLLQPPIAGDNPEAVGTLLFRYVQQHSELCRVLLGSQGSTLLMRRVQEAGINQVLRQHTPREDSPVPPDIAANHLVAASIALIQWWLDHDMPYPPERMGTIYSELIIRPTQTIAFNT